MERVEDLIRRYYAGVETGNRALERAIEQALCSGRTMVLDAGCGAEGTLMRKLSDRARVVGIDLCEELPVGLEVVRGDLSNLPFREKSFSLVFSRSVFEHLPYPDAVMAEFHRVLEPRGLCVILTPARFDYSSIVAALTPHAFHAWFIRWIYGHSAYDTFPTLYRANTPSYFRNLVRRQPGWVVRELSGVRHYPVNLSFSRILFRLGILYDLLVARMRLPALQPNLLVILEKQ